MGRRKAAPQQAPTTLPEAIACINRYLVIEHTIAQAETDADVKHPHRRDIKHCLDAKRDLLPVACAHSGPPRLTCGASGARRTRQQVREERVRRHEVCAGVCGLVALDHVARQHIAV